MTQANRILNSSALLRLIHEAAGVALDQIQPSTMVYGNALVTFETSLRERFGLIVDLPPLPGQTVAELFHKLGIVQER